MGEKSVPFFTYDVITQQMHKSNNEPTWVTLLSDSAVRFVDNTVVFWGGNGNIGGNGFPKCLVTLCWWI